MAAAEGGGTPAGSASAVGAVPLGAAAAAAGRASGGRAAPAVVKAKPKPRSLLLHPAAKALLFAACLLPFGWLFWQAYADLLGANPAEALIRRTGDWTLRFLCITLAVTPLRQALHQPALLRFRRMLGLFTFFYVVLHFLSYAWLDMGLDLQAIVKDIPKRPFALVGFLAFLLMVPLAATSFNRAIKALGAKRWQALHKSIYAIVLLGLLHFFWMKAGKNDFGEWSIYAAVVAFLLGWRLLRAWRERRRAATPGPAGIATRQAAER